MQLAIERRFYNKPLAEASAAMFACDRRLDKFDSGTRV